MIYSTYIKPYKTPSDLIVKLKSQNLTVNDESKALKVLSSVNYFRFKIYLRPLLDINTKHYLPNATFENAFELYSFDEELKNILFKLISNIEINLRTKLDQYVTSFTNSPFWYLEDQYFTNHEEMSFEDLKMVLHFTIKKTI
jgi:abortive infection bacteriophage resistance protein